MPKEKFYLTTSIAYTNSWPHLGFALESVQADVLARYERDRGKEVWFLTGTDEHGEKIRRAAEAAALSPKTFTARISKRFRELKKTLNLSWNDFVRTSDKRKHWPGALKLFSELRERGDIYLKKYRGLYCLGCEGFVTEKELVHGLCPYHKKKPEIVEEENFFFRLSQYGERIKKAISEGSFLILPESRQRETLAFLEGGLEDISVSRSKKSNPWGIPIPGSDQVMYVWIDALTNYLSALGYGRSSLSAKKKFEKYWPADIQIIGKDILRFHTVIWPAMLMSLGLTLPRKILVHGFVTAGGEKISKSLGNVIDPFELTKKYGSDPLRYYLLREIPSDEDGDFSCEKLEERYNADLADGLGNFASRVSALASRTDSIPSFSVSEEVEAAVLKTKNEISEHLAKFKIHESLASIWKLIKFGDIYVNKNRPWETGDKQVVFDLVFILNELGDFLSPFLPEASKKIKQAVSMRGKRVKVKKLPPLFPKPEKAILKT